MATVPLTGGRHAGYDVVGAGKPTLFGGTVALPYATLERCIAVGAFA